MPLHLLGKKSWNVYNSENVERVRRDEADAQAREEAEEQRLQEEDAARRIAVLRGDDLPKLPISPARETGKSEERTLDAGVPRKRRKLRGEDDTDRDIRHARDDIGAGLKARQTLLKHSDGDAPLQDHAGHIQLIPAPDEKAIRKAQKNDEAEAEKAKKRRHEEDQYTMRFSNAAGFKNGMDNPWYSSSKTLVSNNSAVVLADVQDRDVWGNEDPRRKEREQSRLSTNDPFAAMQQAQRQLKQSEFDREKWNKERRAEIEKLQHAEERRRRHEKKDRRRQRDEDGLEGFSLDNSSTRKHERGDHNRHHRHHGHKRSRNQPSERYRSAKHHSRQD